MFITADQLRADCLFGRYADFVKTPNLDKLMRSAVTFERHYTTVCPCGPARASLHTGTYLFNHGVYDNGVPMNGLLTNWAQVLRKSGLVHRTLIGYVDTVPDLRRERMDDIHWDGGYMPGLKRIDDTDYIGSKLFLSSKLDLSQSSKETKRIIENTKKRQWNGYRGSMEWLALRKDHAKVPTGYSAPALYSACDSDAHILVDRCIEHIKTNSHFAVHLSLLKPHPPWTSPKPYNEMYRYDDCKRIFERTRGVHHKSTDAHPWIQKLYSIPNKFAHHGASGSSVGLDDHKKYIAMSNYFGLITEMDDNVGRLLEYLKSSGKQESTLIIFTCDHGEQLYDHDLVGKLGFFEDSFHIPLIIYDPFSASRRGGTQIDHFTESIDVCPTILNWFGVDIPVEIDGQSLLPYCLHSESKLLKENPRNFVHWEYNFSTWGWTEEVCCRECECLHSLLR